MNQNIGKLPTLFWVIAVIALLWNAMGVFAFLSDMLISEEALQAMEPAHRSLYESSPIYQKVAYGLAVFTGILGAVGLLVKKAWAVPVFLASLICVVVQLLISVLATDALKILGASAMLMPSVVILIAAFLYWHAGNAKKRGQIT